MRRLLVLLLTSLSLMHLLSGCDTDDALQKQEFDLLVAEERGLKGLNEVLSNSAALEGSGRVSLFLSSGMLNGLLAGASGVKVAIPGVDGAQVLVNSMRTEFRIGLPLVRIDATATKAGLDAELSLVGTARIESTIAAGSPQKLILRVHLDSLVPRAQWGILDWKVGGFVRDLLRVKLTDELRTVGVIEIPVEGNLPLTLPAKQTPVSFKGANANVNTPALSLAGRATVTQVLTLPDGLHVYGAVSASGAGT